MSPTPPPLSEITATQRKALEGVASAIWRQVYPSRTGDVWWDHAKVMVLLHRAVYPHPAKAVTAPKDADLIQSLIAHIEHYGCDGQASAILHILKGLDGSDANKAEAEHARDVAVDEAHEQLALDRATLRLSISELVERHANQVLSITRYQAQLAKAVEETVLATKQHQEQLAKVVKERDAARDELAHSQHDRDHARLTREQKDVLMERNRELIAEVDRAEARNEDYRLKLHVRDQQRPEQRRAVWAEVAKRVAQERSAAFGLTRDVLTRLMVWADAQAKTPTCGADVPHCGETAPATEPDTIPWV
jgi:hypothetical protein